MIFFRGYLRRRKAWKDGVAHATLSSDGSGVARLYLIPPKPSILDDPPSMLLINGTWFLPIGPSWASILRVFIEELQTYTMEKGRISPDLHRQINESVVSRVKKLYPFANEDMILGDMTDIITLAVNIATNHEVPAETLTGFGPEQFGRYMTSPYRMELLVTPASDHDIRSCPQECLCNNSCCGGMINVEKSLTTEGWKQVIDRCRDIGIPMLTFSGGDPLARPDIVELVQHAEWFVTFINSNASLLTPELACKLFKASLDGIRITLYSHDPAIHNVLVGTEGAWEKTVEGIKNAVKAGLNVSIYTPIVEENKDYNETIKFIFYLGIRSLRCTGLIPAVNDSEQINNGVLLPPAELTSILKSAVKLCNELNMDISFTTPGCLNPEGIAEIGLQNVPVCGACLTNMAIAPDGQAIPCQFWPDSLSIGDIRGIDWMGIWYNKSCKDIRKISCSNLPLKLKGDVEH